MKVVALKMGFFGGSLREPGATFEVPDDIEATWFVPADGEQAKAAKPTKGKAKEQPKALSELAAPGKSFNETLA